MTLRDVDLTVGAFVGRLKYRDTGAPKMCDVCGKDPAMWSHPKKKPKPGEPVNAYLCFGCGDH